MKKFLFLFLLTPILMFGQSYNKGVFGTSATPLDTAQVANTNTLTSRVISISRSFAYEGAATLWAGGDTLSGTPADITVDYRLYGGITEQGDTLVSEWNALGTIGATLLIAEAASLTMLVVKAFAIPQKTTWTYSYGVQFRFISQGTQVNRITARFAQK